MLSRPLLVNPADCAMVMPTLTLENNPLRPDQPSPFRHMNLHCQLCIDMAAQLGGAADSEGEKAQVAKRMWDAVEKWFEALPAEYAAKRAPETRWDGELEWVVFQRRYLHLIGYMGLFSQLRPFIPRNSAKPMSDLESTLRAAGVDAALGLMDASWALFENLTSVGAKFHYAIFCIFDAATVMCSAFLQDEARSLPHREMVLEAIRKALSMLAEVAPQSKTTATLYRILRGLLTKLPLSVREKGLVGVSKRAKNGRVAPSNDRYPAVRSTSDLVASNVQQGTAGANRGRGPSGSSSSDSDSVPGSSKQPRSEGFASSSESWRSTIGQATTGGQAPSGPVLPSNTAPPVGGPPSHTFVASHPVSPAYPRTADGFMPASVATSTTAFVASGGFQTGTGFVQQTGFQYNPAASPVNAIPFSGPSWEPAQVPLANLCNDASVYQPGNLAGFDSTAPEVLGYWEWQTLGLGHPVSWATQVPPGQNSGRHHHAGLPAGFHDCSESSSTDNLSRCTSDHLGS